MGSRNGLFFLLVLVVSCVSAGARNVMTIEKVTEAENETAKNEYKISQTVKRNELCTLCENFTAQATYFLNENKTQSEIIEILHHACSQLQSYEQQCLLLVDYYAPLFFVEIGKIHPDEFCTKVNLCEETVSVALPKGNDSCTLCHDAVAQILARLKDPDAQFEVIKLLLKECNKMEDYVQECKRLVFRYGPLILVNGEKFFENRDVCAMIHACKPTQESTLRQAIPSETAIA